MKGYNNLFHLDFFRVGTGLTGKGITLMLKQLKKYSSYLDMADRHGWEPFATSVWHIRQAKDPFITLARFLNKKIPVLPEFLVPFVPHFKEPCVKNVF